MMAVNGVVSGPGGLAKLGTGALTLGGACTYSGGTTVAAGTLYVNGSIGEPIVQSGATLGGNGVINGPLTVQGGGGGGGGGCLAPGVGGIGTLTVNSTSPSPARRSWKSTGAPLPIATR